jgi:hypothetical protein
MKTCNNCKEELPIDQFHKNKRLKSGYVSTCKKCISEYNRLKYPEIKGRMLDYQKEYIKSNKKLVRAKRRAYYNKNRERILEAAKERSASFPDSDVESKVCAICQEVKPSSEFSKSKTNRSGLSSYCKECNKEKGKQRKESKKASPSAVFEIIRRLALYRGLYACVKCWQTKETQEFNNSKHHVYGLYPTCKECRKPYLKERASDNAADLRKKTRAYYKKNKAKVNKKNSERARQRRKGDIEYRILCNLRRRVHAALKGNTKLKRTKELLGCSVSFARNHIESQFIKGMSWDNYGEWHIDHKIPCKAFDLKDPIQQRQCFHYSNLQPLWAEDNLKKSAKIEKPIQMRIAI